MNTAGVEHVEVESVIDEDLLHVDVHGHSNLNKGLEEDSDSREFLSKEVKLTTELCVDEGDHGLDLNYEHRGGLGKEGCL